MKKKGVTKQVRMISFGVSSQIFFVCFFFFGLVIFLSDFESRFKVAALLVLFAYSFCVSYLVFSASKYVEMKARGKI